MAVNRTSKAKGKVVDIPANAPTIGTPTDAGDGTTANVAFTAPSTSTGGPIFTYTAVSSPGSFTGTGTSSPVSITGLTTGTSYTFTVKANNPTGSSPASSASTSLTITQPTHYYSIASTTLTSQSAAIVFSSIPQTYKHLQMRVYARSTRPATTIDNLWMQINNDTSSGTYGYHMFYGDGTTTTFNGSATGAVSALPGGPVPGDAANSNFFNSVIIDFWDYASTSKWKTVRSFGGMDLNNTGTGRVGSYSFAYESTSGITKISIDDQSGYNWAVGTVIALYGLKG
jgi:hypothetical protein